MKIISFAWTTPALLAGRKTCTRRKWKSDYARSFRRDELVQAYDKNPRAGGKQVAIIRLTATPTWQRMRHFPEADYEAEGFKWMEEQGMTIKGKSPVAFLLAWMQTTNELVSVVRFEVVSYTKGGENEKKAEDNRGNSAH